MSQPDSPARLRFDGFEIDLRTRELRKDGRVVKLQDQPIKLLTLLASRAGELVTRTEIEKALWGDDEFVEFEHGINTAMRKIREALGDSLESPRFIETLPRKGYRFLVPVETDGVGGAGYSVQAEASPPAPSPSAQSLRDKIPVRGASGENASLPKAQEAKPEPEPVAPAPVSAPREEFALHQGWARSLFLLIQGGYLAMYCAALYKADALDDAIRPVFLGSAELAAPLIIVSGMCGIAVRLYLLSAVGLGHPEAGQKFRRLFPALFVLDTLWAASPLLLARKIGFGAALASVAGLAYLPFAQRTLMQSIHRDARSTAPSVPRAG